MRYPLYNLDDKEFEQLVALICEQILGMGTIVFADGKDGGRDGKFTGKANKYPSETKPWDGKFIIQAKHTSKPVASCSDSDFKAILKKEVVNVKKLKEAQKLDYYMLFTNRKLTGLQDPKIEDFIDEKSGVENVVIDIDRIQLWLQEYPHIVKALNLNRLLMPLEFYEKDLQEIVLAFSKATINISTSQLKQIQDEIKRIPIQTKNELNKLSKDYFDDVLRRSYSNFEKIKAFLQDPRNNAFKEYYVNTVNDIQDEITVKRDEYHAFDEILNHLYKIVFDASNEEIKNKRTLLRTFLHYMYFNCDIGKKE